MGGRLTMPFKTIWIRKKKHGIRWYNNNSGSIWVVASYVIIDKLFSLFVSRKNKVKSDKHEMKRKKLCDCAD